MIFGGGRSRRHGTIKNERMSTVLPARGSARLPLPIGATMSVAFAERFLRLGSSISIRKRWLGNSGLGKLAVSIAATASPARVSNIKVV